MMRHDAMPELPPGLHMGDLRYVEPELYSVEMASQGWAVTVQHLDDNPAKMRIVLSRPLPPDFTDERVAHLADRMHIVDIEERGYKEGYLFRREQNSNDQTIYGLYFEFSGFPTAGTMLALHELEKAFPALKLKEGRLRRLARLLLPN